MKLLLATLCLNEMEWLPRLWQQHKDWPGCIQWVFIESADRVYAETNPELVTDKGLSVDGTSEYLQQLAQQDPRVVYVPYGFSKHDNPAQGKVDSRQQYLNIANQTKPQFVFVLDADEFYSRNSQKQVNDLLCLTNGGYNAFIFKQRHIWHPQSINEQPLFQYEVMGGYWDVPHCRGWRWCPGMRYNHNHNTPENAQGVSLDAMVKRYDKKRTTPYCVHMGFAANRMLRSAKHKYYVARGEGAADGRQWYVDCRQAFETWQPNQHLPHKASIKPFDGEIPEAFLLRVPA